MRENKMKALIKARKPALGCSIMVPSPQMVEVIAYCGFDWVLIDMEHGTIGLESAELMVMAAEVSGVTPIIRPPTNRKADISAVMDIGAQGVQVPHVNTAEDARNAVRAVKFMPGDNRSLASSTRPNDYGFGGSMSDYALTANEQSLVCVQLEHAEAIANIDEILAVEDIDVFFIGPSDLSQSMGQPGDPAATPVADAVAQSLARINRSGHASGMPATTAKVEQVLAAGCTYIYTHLPNMVRAGSAEFFAASGRR
ncbi:MAG: HpcH/HpaI aldolase family protein [Hyphomicrobiales bacterium]